MPTNLAPLTNRGTVCGQAFLAYAGKNGKRFGLTASGTGKGRGVGLIGDPPSGPPTHSNQPLQTPGGGALGDGPKAAA